MSAGKGSKQRPTDLNVFRENHDRIFGSRTTTPEGPADEIERLARRTQTSENSAAGDGCCVSPCSDSSFWVVDANYISGLKPPMDTPRSNWLSQSVAKAWNALPEELRPRAVVISFRTRGVQSAGFMWAMLDLFDIEGIPVIVAHNNWVRLKMPGVNKLPVGEVQEGGV